MGLPPVFKTKSSSFPLYITLLLSDSNIQAALWQLTDSEINIVSKSTIYEYSDDKQAVIQADKALQNLGKQSEKVNDVVFGLPHTWVDDQGVTVVKKPLLKAITEELDLKAVGFIETSEALAKHLAIQDPRLAMLLVEFSQYEVYLSLINQGKLIATKYVGRSGDTVADMAEALARLSADQVEKVNLPSKIVIVSLDLDESELTEQQQLLSNYDWMSAYSFTHPPTVDSLDKEIILEAIIKQGGGPAAGRPFVADKNKLENPSKEVMKPETSELAVELESPVTQAVRFEPLLHSDNLKGEIRSKINDQDEVNSNLIEMEEELSYQKNMKFKNWFAEHKKFALGGFFAGLLALIALTGVWLNMGVKAMVSLSLVAKPIARETNITLNPKAGSTDADELVLAANTIEQQVAGKKTKETTGIKVVGDKAIGKIVIYNKTDSIKIFDQGTKISKGDLVFTLDEEVTVASASDKGDVTEHGKVEVEVTAVEIGADYNLAKEVNFQVASFDSGTYSAESLEAFSGGSSREVKVVSANDKDQLLIELKEKLLKEAQQKIEEKMSAGEYVASVDIYRVDKQQLDAEIGEEIGSVTLDLSVTVQALTYKTEDLKPLAQKVLEADVPDGYTLANSEPQILSVPDQESSGSGTVNLAVNITSEAKPSLDLNQLKQQIVGKSIVEAESILAAQDGINSAKINLIPGLAAHLYPRVPKDVAKIDMQ